MSAWKRANGHATATSAPRNGFSPNGGHIARALACAIALLALLLSYNSNLASSQSGGGGSPTDTPTPTSTPTWNVTWKDSTSDLSIFVSTTKLSGSGWVGLSQMQGECQTLATAQGYGGTWYPLVSDSTWDARNVLNYNGSGGQTRNIWNMNSQIVVTTEAALFDGSSWGTSRFKYYEDRSAWDVNTDPYAYTGSNYLGQLAYWTCGDWQLGDAIYSGENGHPEQDSSSGFLDNGTNTCDTLAPIYCIGDYVPPTYTPTITPTPTPTWNVTWKDTSEDLYIFIHPTAAPGDSWGGGLEGMRSACQAAATSNGLHGTWYPLVSSTAWDANQVTGTNTTRNIYNMNSQLIASSEAALWDAANNPFTYYPDYYPNGTQPAVWDKTTYTGSNPDGTKKLDWYTSPDINDACLDWTDGTINQGAVVGNAGYGDSCWMNCGYDGCYQSYRILCIGNYAPPTSTPTNTPPRQLPPGTSPGKTPPAT